MNRKSFNVTAAAKTLKEKHRLENEQLEKRRSRGYETAVAAVKFMAAADSTLLKVIGFGSTFETWRSYRFDSDIDLAVVGGSMRLLEDSLPESEFEISIIELDCQSSEFQNLVLENGTVLYEK